MIVNIVDTTLRDGEQRAGIAFGRNEKIKIAMLLNELGIHQIEAGIPAMGGEEKDSIREIARLNLKSKVSAWNRMNIKDIESSMECGVEIIHVSVPSSDLQIEWKLKKDREWVEENMQECINLVRESGFAATVGFEDASRADFQFLKQLIGTAVSCGVKRVRYADTVGIVHRKRIYDEIKELKDTFDVDIEIHTHNDFGMAVANALAAAKAGAGYVNCTISGIGERAGNCDYIQFMNALSGCMKMPDVVDRDTYNKLCNVLKRIPHA